LIDADELRDKIIQRIIEEDTEFPEYDWGTGLSIAKDILERTPTVDAEPVRHGTWIVEYEVKDGRSMRCSECQMVFWVGSGRNGNYCPNCGAKMDEQEKQK